MSGEVATAARCPTEGCGAPAGRGHPRSGWVQVKVAGSGDPARWYCCGACATRGIIRTELGTHDLINSAVLARPNDTIRRRGQSRLAAAGYGHAEVRQWARANGIRVAGAGHPARHVIDAFLRAKGVVDEEAG